jgi:glycosyltransferase involved in cell wall biosynthesis
VPPVSGNLRVAIDVRPLSLETVTGVGLVIQLILEELERRGTTFVGVTNRPPPPGRIAPSIPIVAEPGRGGRIRWESRTLPRILRGLHHAPDLYHATWNHGLPGGLPFPSVLTIHDLIPWRFPGEVPWPKPSWVHRALYRRAIRASARAANAIVTVSEASRRDIVALLPDAAERVEVVPVPLPHWFPRSDPEGRRAGGRAADGSAGYWLYLGGFDPRKGIRTLLLAIHATFPDPSRAPELVLAGAINEHAREMETMARGLGIRARFPGYVPDEGLPALFEGASLFLYPSRHEGFGIPLLFAMAAGVPSIVSDGGSLPEVIGDAGLTFPAGDVAALSKLLANAHSDPDSLADYAARGVARIARFSPDLFARRMIRVYERAAGRRGESA